MDLSSGQFSSYDERPDPKKPGQQGVLFRKLAPAQDQRRREHLAPEESLATLKKRAGKSKKAGGFSTDPHARYNDPENWRDERQLKGRATGMVPEGGMLYHGTAARLQPGSKIVPGKEPNFGTTVTGAINDYGRSHDVNREHAFAGTDLAESHRYARIAQEMRNQRSGGNSARANVYAVRPVGPVQTDAEDSDARAGYANPDEPHAFQSKQGFQVLHPVQFSEHQEAYREFHEDELGMEPGGYKWAPKTPAHWPGGGRVLPGDW